MATLEAGLVTYLKTVGAVTALIGSSPMRFWPLQLPDQWVSRAAVYRRVSTVRERDLSGETGRARVRLQIDCYAHRDQGHELSDAKALAAAIRAAVVDYQGAWGSVAIGTVAIENERDDTNREARASWSSLDILVTHRE